MDARTQRIAQSKKAATLVVTCVLAVSITGFFIGLQQTSRNVAPPPIPAIAAPGQDSPYASPHDVPLSRGYMELADQPLGPNRGFKSHLRDLRASGLQDSPTDDDPEQRRTRRAALRAYDGAPPVIPHSIDQHSAASCMQCHTEATRIGDRVAPAISHPVYTSCTQCHVADKGLGSGWSLADIDLHTGNRFSGTFAEARGERASPEAPPTIPHTIHMRQSCMSCHGQHGTSPLRTTHPERQSCMQCHVPGRDVPKSNFKESPFPLIDELMEAKLKL